MIDPVFHTSVLKRYWEKSLSITMMLFASLILTGVAFAEEAYIDVSTGQPFTLPGFFQRPTSIAYDTFRDQIAISDIGQNRIYIIDLSDYSWITLDEANKIDQPSGLAFSKDGRLFVSSNISSRILVFGYNSDIPDTLDLDATGIPIKTEVTHIYIDDSERLFLIDSRNRDIFVFDLSGDMLGRISDDLTKPGGILVRPSGDILVADKGLDPISHFTKDFSYLGRLTRPEPVTSKPLRSTQGMAADKSGWIYTVDVLNNKVLIFDPSGVRQTEWAPDIQPFFPVDIAIDRNDIIYILESGGGRLLMYRKGY